jgi:hypothetical protein
MAQETTQFSKECRISSGYTYANGINNSKGGSSIFFQMSYKVSPKFSIATEFENLNFEMPGYHEDLPIKPNIQNIFDNYFSLMIKYHLPLKSKFNAELASGWTFYTNQNEYYDYYKDATTESISYKVTSFSDFGIPFLLETHYPLWKNFNTGIRVKYNFNPGQNSTYSVGIGVSLIL